MCAYQPKADRRVCLGLRPRHVHLLGAEGSYHSTRVYFRRILFKWRPSGAPFGEIKLREGGFVAVEKKCAFQLKSREMANYVHSTPEIA